VELVQDEAMPLLTSALVPVGSLASSDQPTLDADGLTLRPWTHHDADTLVTAYTDPAIRYWHARTMTDRDDAVTWVDERHELWAGEQSADWAVTDGPTIVGRVALHHFNLHEGVMEVGYWVLPQARRRGVAARSVAGAVRWAFDDVGLLRVELEHSTLNEPSCRVAGVLGFELEGVRRAHYLQTDGRHDTHLHARLAPGVTSVPPGDTAIGGQAGPAARA